MQSSYDGIIVMDKPSGMTSHDLVDSVRKIFSMKRVGHGGTLDPMATGVLPVMLGKATLLSMHLSGSDKEYEGEMLMGRETDTLDITGKTLGEKGAAGLDIGRIEAAAALFTGEIEQVPPMFSAIKVDGRRLHDLARRGIEVKREKRRVFIHEMKILGYRPPVASFKVTCSKGTYIRSLAADIGRSLGCGACHPRHEGKL